MQFVTLLSNRKAVSSGDRPSAHVYYLRRSCCTMSKEVKVNERSSLTLRSCHVTSRFITQVGIIGGTGLDNPDLLEDRVEKEVDTPFGKARDSSIF